MPEPLVFLASALLFQVEMILAKHLLPWFGGAPMVWATALVTFQTLLLGGYAYACVLQRLRPARQAALQASLLVLAAGLPAATWVLTGNPVLPPPGAAAGIGAPGARIAVLLTLYAGLPFLLLAATSPLVQAWTASARGGRAYRLYAVSNAGSLAGLLGYPVLVEPYLATTAQARIWTVGFWLFMLLSLHLLPRRSTAPAVAEPPPLPRPGARARVAWFLLAALPAMLLVSATNQVTANVAPVPLLWVLPLTLYLLTFMLVFSGHRHAPEWVLAVLVVAGGYGAWFAMTRTLSLPILPQLAAHLAMLFVGALLCHQRLYRLRPDPARLTGYYLVVAAGGAAGGLLVSIGAPLLLNGLWEYPISVALSALAAACILFTAPEQGSRSWQIPVATAAVVLAGLVHQDVRRQRQHVIFEERNFYGAIQVHEQVHGDGSVLRSLMHGRVCHGIQFDRPPRRSTPSSYFSAEAGLGKAITAMRARGRPLRIGALGMGIGVLAAYGEHGDSINFFELNPAVIKLARNTDYFTYLADSRASIHITEGDARLELEEERRSGNDEPYDMLVIDVFSGDSVPVHCLTSEAFSLYAKSLTPDGILAVHVSNAFLDLTQPVRAATKHLGWHSAYIRTRGDRFLTADAAWILLAYSEDALSNTCITEATTPWPTPLRMDDPWTDRFSSLYPLLTWTPRSPLAPRMEQGSRP